MEAWKMNIARNCLHASLACDDPALIPDYKCNINRKQPDGKGPPCVLHLRDHCDKMEPFPEAFDH